ncbi:MAG: hypothetical protein WA113_05285 [Desulfitobacteriaceae bacterium]
MNYGGQGSGPYGSNEQQGFPGQVPSGQYGPPPQAPGGSIRNNLGAGLKESGFFQKDGQINNLRGGFIGSKQPQVGQIAPPNYGTVIQPRQLILQAAQEGIVGNGIATIAPDNSFFLMANLPAAHSFLNPGQSQGSATYACYLVDNKGKTGFLAGVLRPVGNGVFQAQFRSSVPLTHYDKVVVSVENPQYLGQAPNGPIILKVKEPMGAAAFLNPVLNVGGSLWKKVSGLFSGKGKVPISPVVPETNQVVPELVQSLSQMGVNPPD